MQDHHQHAQPTRTRCNKIHVMSNQKCKWSTVMTQKAIRAHEEFLSENLLGIAHRTVFLQAQYLWSKNGQNLHLSLQKTFSVQMKATTRTFTLFQDLCITLMNQLSHHSRNTIELISSRDLLFWISALHGSHTIHWSLKITWREYLRQAWILSNWWPTISLRIMKLGTCKWMTESVITEIVFFVIHAYSLLLLFFLQECESITSIRRQ